MIICKRLIVHLIFVSLLTACSQSSNDEKSSDQFLAPKPELSNFSFLTANNPELSADIVLNFDASSNTFSGVISQNISVKNLIATFQFSGSRVEVSGIVQSSGSTENDFTRIVNYLVYTETDTISYAVDVTRFTGIPVMEIQTIDFLAVDSRDTYVEAKIEIEGWRYHDSNLQSSIKIRGRGHSTWDWYPKKPYQIKFDTAASVLSMPEERRWILLAEYADKTLMRNKIAFELGEFSDLPWVPSSEFLELFVNSEYQGTYHLVEKIELASNRIDPERSKYLLEIDQLDRLDVNSPYFVSNFFLFHLKEPEISQESAEIIEVRNMVLEFEDALLNQRFLDNPQVYESLINLKSFVDWFLINEITKNIDAGAFYSSVYLTISVDDKIELGPIWDFDLSMAGDYEGWWMTSNPWFELLLLDPYFVNLVKARFNHFYANKTEIINKIDELEVHLDLASKQNDVKWATIGTYIFPNPVYFQTYAEEVDFLKNWISNRLDWLEQEISDL